MRCGYSACQASALAGAVALTAVRPHRCYSTRTLANTSIASNAGTSAVVGSDRALLQTSLRREGGVHFTPVRYQSTTSSTGNTGEAPVKFVEVSVPSEATGTLPPPLPSSPAEALPKAADSSATTSTASTTASAPQPGTSASFATASPRTTIAFFNTGASSSSSSSSPSSAAAMDILEEWANGDFTKHPLTGLHLSQCVAIATLQPRPMHTEDKRAANASGSTTTAESAGPAPSSLLSPVMVELVTAVGREVTSHYNMQGHPKAAERIFEDVRKGVLSPESLQFATHAVYTALQVYEADLQTGEHKPSQPWSTWKKTRTTTTRTTNQVFEEGELRPLKWMEQMELNLTLESLRVLLDVPLPHVYTAPRPKTPAEVAASNLAAKNAVKNSPVGALFHIRQLYQSACDDTSLTALGKMGAADADGAAAAAAASGGGEPHAASPPHAARTLSAPRRLYWMQEARLLTAVVYPFLIKPPTANTTPAEELAYKETLDAFKATMRVVYDTKPTEHFRFAHKLHYSTTVLLPYVVWNFDEVYRMRRRRYDRPAHGVGEKEEVGAGGQGQGKMAGGKHSSKHQQQHASTPAGTVPSDKKNQLTLIVFTLLVLAYGVSRYLNLEQATAKESTNDVDPAMGGGRGATKRKNAASQGTVSQEAIVMVKVNPNDLKDTDYEVEKKHT